MKIKHWAGYGCIEGKAITRQKYYAVVEVWGNHERGLYSPYVDYYRWLGKRFRLNEMEAFKFENWYEGDIEHLAIYMRKEA